VAGIVAALAMWQVGHRPFVLIADTGALIGVMTGDGRALSREKGAGFVARNWLENDGDGVEQKVAAARWSDPEQSGLRLIHLTGKRAIAAFAGCATGDVVVMNGAPEGASISDCLILDPSALRATGAVSIVRAQGQMRVVTARDVAGDRMWSGWARYDRVPVQLPIQTDAVIAKTD
jgi:competence protein ComEC